MAEVVTPGENLGYEEEFSAGENAYVHSESGLVRSKILGYLLRDWNARVLKVKPVKKIKYLMDKGDIVHASVVGFKDTVVIVNIFFNESKNVFVPAQSTGIILASRISGWRVKLYKEVFGYGDIVRAVVVERGGPPYSLSTKGREFGVILAKCPKCSSTLVKRGPALICPNCKTRAKRKVSSKYIVT
ncbi:MAG: exosome complex RNA-binding protein Csl4 [Thermofilum sp.]